MTSPVFARHSPEVAGDDEIRLIKAAAASVAEGAALYTAHIDKLEAVRASAGQGIHHAYDWSSPKAGTPVAPPEVQLAACGLLQQKAATAAAGETERWDALVQAMGTAQCEVFAMPVLADKGGEVAVTFLDAMLCSAYVSGGQAYPQALCGAMLGAGVLNVQLSKELAVSLLGVLEACASFWQAQNSGDSAAAFFIVLADAQCLAGRVDAAIASLGNALELAPVEPYPWAVLAELLAGEGDTASVSIQGFGDVNAKTAKERAETVAKQQQTKIVIGWTTIAAAVVGAVGIGLLVMRLRARSRAQAATA